MDVQLKKILFIGDKADALYHPSSEIFESVKATLAGSFSLTFMDNYAELTLGQLRNYDLLINYADNWENKGSAKAAGAVLAYAASGGSIMGLHGGIIAPLDKFPEIPMVFGARFDSHPPYCELSFIPAENSRNHPIVKGITPFVMGEEPYLFELCNFCSRNVLLEYEYEGKKYPAAWTVKLGEGRIFYLYPGHDIRTFNHPDMKKLLLQGALWTVGILD